MPRERSGRSGVLTALLGTATMGCDRAVGTLLELGEALLDRLEARILLPEFALQVVDASLLLAEALPEALEAAAELGTSFTRRSGIHDLLSVAESLPMVAQPPNMAGAAGDAGHERVNPHFRWDILRPPFFG
jgi:hypothetical protein